MRNLTKDVKKVIRKMNMFVSLYAKMTHSLMKHERMSDSVIKKN